MDMNTYASLASAVVAGLAFLFSIYTLYRQRQDNASRLQILHPCSIPGDDNKEDGHSPLIIYLISNCGAKPIYIFEVSLHVPSLGFIAPLKLNELKLPHRLESGEALEVNSKFDELLKAIVRKCIEENNNEGFIVIRDGEWKAYKSEIFDLNVDDTSVFSDEPFYATCPHNPDKPGFIVKRSVRK